MRQAPLAAPAVSALNLALAQEKANAPRASTIVYVHGIGNKPVCSVLKCQWDHALFPSLPAHAELGERSRMAYWVNREFYPTPSPASCGAGDRVTEDLEEAAALGVLSPQQGGDAVEREIVALAGGDARQEAVLRAVAAQAADFDGDDQAAAAFTALQVSAKVLPLPGFLRRMITRQLTRRLLRDVHDFFFVPERRRAMRESVLDRLEVGGGPFVVIAHSQGSMIAYDVLRTLSKAQAHVTLFVTIGSPLGLDEVQDVLTGKDFANAKQLPFPPCVDRWVNVAERLDPVSADTDLRNDFPSWADVENYQGFNLNPDAPRHPHSATGYLAAEPVRCHVMAAVGVEFSQPVSEFAIARDLVAELEDHGREALHEVLIELRTPEMDRHDAEAEDRQGGGSRPQRGREARRLVGTLDVRRQRVVAAVKDVTTRTRRDKEDVKIEELRRFVAVRLTRREVEELRARYKELAINAVWRDAAKKAMIDSSTHMVQARPANRGYAANGERVHWAVLDTGVWQDHPHFERYDNVEALWDCTKPGPLTTEWEADADRPRLDGNGHGTHVAGIIAGSHAFPPDGQRTEPLELEGMAPRAKLHVYKVLRDDGTGSDSFIIKALDHIAEANEREPELAIHGVNLSLGGAFDPRVYGCGHSPLCRELRRLWRQGVLVVIAAGNEGRAQVAGENGTLDMNLALSISDPANLEEAIAVGSVHKTNPHTYGVTYFSSRGPTADGRQKPDVVAPGERIRSAYHLGPDRPAPGAPPPPQPPTPRDLYVEMDGTSMAAPHVSGVLAAFLSRRPEFIGYPDRVKKILLDNCTDLGRESYFQGKGMPNLIKMLANS